jgi:nucleoside-diphosphate-sugar epimerase
VSRRIFLAGASSAVGGRLLPLLLAAGHDVTGTTRTPAKIEPLRTLGARPAVVDAFDADALSRAVVAARPEIVIHQLTDLPDALDPSKMDDAIVRNARLRDEGTRNLVRAALAAGARRLVAQSIVWAYAPGPEPHGEDDPLDLAATGERGITVRGTAMLEQRAMHAPPLEAVILRYGFFYGPGTGFEAPHDLPPLHVDAAAHAAALAVDRGLGLYNIAERSAYASTERARRELGWSDRFRC